MSVELTDEEEKWIRSLQRVCKKHPKSLWLFNNGTMYVMKYPEDGSSEMGSNGGVNQDYIVALIKGIHSDGGDW